MNGQNFDVLLVGAGNMALEYSRVLDQLKLKPLVVGRGEGSAKSFHGETGQEVISGGVERLFEQHEEFPSQAIVTVNAQSLAETSNKLMQNGVNRLLIEKPAALDFDELESLQKNADEFNAEVYVAYNRRFYASVLMAEKIIAKDGGVRSLKFDFTETARRIATLGKSERELSTWFYGNSTHVLDLAFHFFGEPDEIVAHVYGGGIDWHPHASVFNGFATKKNPESVMSWASNWEAPGRWGVEIFTTEHRLILQPIEKLRVQVHNSFQETELELEDEDDTRFKPGLYKQTRAFLLSEMSEKLVTLSEHANHMQYYDVILKGSR